MVKQPNFFILGAPKAGTTALYAYLREHPEIFFPEVKEPHFFARDLVDATRVTSPDEYLSFYRSAGPRHRMLGDASVWYLFSETAVPGILDFSPQAKFIVMLRNPVDLAYSLFAQARYNLLEDQEDFASAWALQDVRAAGSGAAGGGRMHHSLQYRRAALLGEQLQRLYSHADAASVKLVFFEDFVADTPSSYAEVLEFLGLGNDNRQEFRKVNESKKHRNRLLAGITESRPPALVTAVRLLREHTGISASRPLSWLRRVNELPYQRAPLEPAFRAGLVASFEDDIRLLETLTGRDLAHWRTPD